MAAGRILSRRISLSTKVNLELKTDQARLLFSWMLAHCDDYGRTDANPVIIKGEVVPMLWDFGVFLKAYQELIDVRLVVIYISAGNAILQVINFDDHQSGAFRRRRVVKYSPPQAANIVILDIMNLVSTGGADQQVLRLEQEATRQGEAGEAGIKNIRHVGDLCIPGLLPADSNPGAVNQPVGADGASARDGYSPSFHPRPPVKHPFSASPFFAFPEFRAQFPDWPEEKARHYHERAAGYSQANGGKYLDWIAAVRNWERSDVAKAAPKPAAPPKPGRPAAYQPRQDNKLK